MSQQPVPQRRYDRVPVRMPVRISTIDAETDPGSGRRYFRASREVCTNLSRGGVFIRTAEPLEPGRRLVVELDLPDGTPFEAVGRVAWTTHRLQRGPRKGVGVQFLGAAPERFANLDAALERLKRRRERGQSRAR